MSSTILVVDDESIITRSLSTLIKVFLKCNVICSNDPVVALESEELLHNKIDMIISDFTMPKMNGLEFLREAKVRCPKAVTIILTGYADKENAIKGINELGLYYYMEKPWDNNALVKVIKNGLEKKRLSDELEERFLQLETSHKEIEHLYSLLERDYHQEIGKNELLEQMVSIKTSAVKNLLDNAGQGFLTFGEDLAIESEYSMECDRIFQKGIKGHKFTDLIMAGSSQEQKDLVDNALVSILKNSDSSKSEILIPLLPDFAKLGSKHIKIEYKVINDAFQKTKNKMLIILTDVSERDNLLKQMEQEKNSLKMVVKAITNYNDFDEVLGGSRYFTSVEMNEILAMNKSVHEIMHMVFRKIHTIKGSLGMFHMNNAVRYLHNVEDRLYELENKGSGLTLEDVTCFCSGLRIQERIDSDLSVIKSVLNGSYYSLNNIAVMDKSKLLEAEEKMSRMLTPSEYMQMLPYIRQYKYRSFKEMLGSYCDYTTGLSDKLGKLVYPLTLEGGDVLVDSGKYKDFVKSLVHVFRNAVDHGIELPDDRLEHGKSDYGNIGCSVEVQEENLCIRIFDDGCGINVNSIREKAIGKGLFSRSEAYGIPDAEIMGLIFSDDFSTRDSVTEFSGRGMGLAAVKAEVEKLGGSISVHTEAGAGTEFLFVLPFSNYSCSPRIKIQDILIPVSVIAKEQVKCQTGLDFVSESSIVQDKTGSLSLKGYNVFTLLRGVVEGRLILGYDEELAKSVFEAFCSDIPEDGGKEKYFEESLLEFTNIITGNAANLFEGFDDLVVLDKPFIIDAKNSSAKYPSYYVWNMEIRFSGGTLNIGFILSEKTFIE
ncbi:MAG: ATP-binding protein [Clostridia bacterium]|nr:ATP-binding protein [Clostridia bacterium]